MTKEQLIDRYMVLYEKMKESKDLKNMKIFGKAEKYIFKELAEKNPEMATRWLSHLEAICWNNYLSENEAINIAKRNINQDGSKGFHWDYNTFIGAVNKLQGEDEKKPYYNTYALWVAANNIYSDHANSIAEDMGYKMPSEVPNEKMALSCYKKAVEKLCDKDNPDYIRDYFRHKMYNNSPA